MSADDENRFRPKPGRIRSDTPKAGKTKSFFTQVKKITRQHQAAAARDPSMPSSARPSSPGRSRAVVASGKGVKRGRGASFVRARNISGHWHHRQPGSRRVIVKQRSVRAAWKGGRARAHLRYVQRDGTSRDGERGRLYSATEDRADGDAFLDRGKDDRHQFRFIVSPEDGAELSDLTAYTRDFMKQVEADLGTKLDWVAVNHYNTGHPHVHIIVNGRDDTGGDLVINGDYLSAGLRERASELASLELGPVTEIEQTRKLSAEIDQDRLTRIDRAMSEEADARFLDLRHEPAEPKRQFERTLRLRRLAKLEKMGLATEHAPAVWELSKDMEPALRELGERGDIIRTMQKALGPQGGERDRQASVRVLSPVNLERQIRSDGATWLDRRLVHGETADLAPAGFGQQVREAMDHRREHHIEQGDATRARNGRIFYRRSLLATLREREVARIGAEMAERKALPFRSATDGESVSGKFTGTVQLSSGKFAVVEQPHEFTLVPWRPVIDRQLGREVMGVVQGGSVSWQLGRQRGISL